MSTTGRWRRADLPGLELLVQGGETIGEIRRLRDGDRERWAWCAYDQLGMEWASGVKRSRYAAQRAVRAALREQTAG
jgi:hypothetical protein